MAARPVARSRAQIPLRLCFLLAEENKKTYAWSTDNQHGIVWEAGSCDHTFIFNFCNALKLRFPNSTVFTKGTEKCTFLRNFFFSVVDLDGRTRLTAD